MSKGKTPDRVRLGVRHDVCTNPECRDTHIASYTRDDLSIEATLVELRVMFPGLQIIVSIRDCGEETTTTRGTSLEYGIQVGMNGKEFDADTLAKAMAQVRKFAAQKKKGKL